MKKKKDNILWMENLILNLNNKERHIKLIVLNLSLIKYIIILFEK